MFDHKAAFDTSGSIAAAGMEDGSVVVIDGTGSAESTSVVIRPSTAPIATIALDGDGRLLAIGDQDGALTLVDRPSGEILWRTIVLPERSYGDVMEPEALAAVPALFGLDGFVFGNGPRDIVFEPDGSLVVAAGVHIRRIDVETGAVTAETIIRSQPNPDLPAIPRNPVSLHSHDDGSLSAIVGSNGFVDLDLDLTEQASAIIPVGRTTRIVATTFVYDSSGVPWFGLGNGQMARGLAEDIADQAIRRVTGLATVRSMALSSDGGRVLAAGRGGLELWAADGRQLLGRAVPHGGNNEFFIAPDGLAVVASSFQLGLEGRIYDLSGPAAEAKEPTALPMTVPYRILPDPLNRHIVAAILDASSLSRSEPTTALLDRASLALVGEVPAGTVPTMSDDGSLLAWGFEGGTVGLFRFPSGEQVGPLVDVSPRLAGDFDFVNNVDLDATNEHLLVSLFSGTTLLYEIDGWTLLASTTPDDEGGGAVTARFLPDGETVVSRNREGSDHPPHRFVADRYRRSAGGIFRIGGAEPRTVR